jgi:ABC-type lipoprotein release transport system permease subunit
MEAAVIGLFGVIVGAILTVILTTAKDWWFHRVKKKEEQTYLAIQISCLLE